MLQEFDTHLNNDTHGRLTAKGRSAIPTTAPLFVLRTLSPTSTPLLALTVALQTDENADSIANP